MNITNNHTLHSAIIREAIFMARDRTMWICILIVLCLSSLAVWSGLSGVEHQRKTITHLNEFDQQERFTQSEKLKDWGSAAYYRFHFTYDPPSDFAFAAMGQRDLLPWKHRIRMLALEGQIYERDVGNPLLALIGRLDFAFLAAFIFPLVLIILLHDLRACEKTARRYELLISLAQGKISFWAIRASLRAGAIFVCLIIPLLFAGIMAQTTLSTLLLASFFVFAYTLFWTLLCYWFSALRISASAILMALTSMWIMLAVIFPASARLTIDKLIPVPAGAKILMTQREAVNDAWDLPKEATMTPFVDRHPQWAEYTSIKGSFEWKWYYAFQQVGDQKTQALTSAYRKGRVDRDRLAAGFSFLAPPSLLERSLQSLAKTDLKAALAYEEQVRNFHGQLRAFYYPKLFRNETFDKTTLESESIFWVPKSSAISK